MYCMYVLSPSFLKDSLKLIVTSKFEFTLQLYGSIQIWHLMINLNRAKGIYTHGGWLARTKITD